MTSNSKIFNMLPVERRKALESEVATSIIRSVLLKNHGKTFGTLVDSLRQSKHWKTFKDVKVSSLLTPIGSAKGRRPRRKQPPKVVETVLSAIKKHPDLRSEELREKTSLDADSVRGALMQLRREGRVKTKGSRRITTYRAA